MAARPFVGRTPDSMAGGSPWRTYGSPFSFAPTPFLSATKAGTCGAGLLEDFGFGPSIDRAVNRVRRRLESEWRGRSGVSPCLFGEGIWRDRDCEEVAACRLDSVPTALRTCAGRHAHSNGRFKTQSHRTSVRPIHALLDRPSADLDGMRLDRNERSAVAIAPPMATYGPVPRIVANTCRHAKLACGDACPVVVRK